MKKITWGLCIALLPVALFAQRQILSANLNQFKNPAANWSITGNVTANPFKDNDLQASPGQGMLVNVHEHGKYGSQYELVSEFTHGDIDLEFDFMMARGSNSGIYMQGNYEIQLLDSWGKKEAKYGDCGGIYQRWDESRPEGMKGYEGYAPRLNACKAPGLWQHMKISFQAPRFNAAGKKTENAKILSVILNGQVLHENVELAGVTRGALTETEVAKGPLRFQGDHGSLAFRNIMLTEFDKPAARLENLNYAVSYAPYNAEADPYNLKTDATGQLKELSWEFLKQPNEYSYRITGDLLVPSDGKYDFSLFSSSNNYLKIDNDFVINNRYTGPNDERTGSVILNAGRHKIELYSAKYDGWMNPALGLFIAGPGFRPAAMHSAGSMLGNKPSDPILVEADGYSNLRSFMDITVNGKPKRVVHAISVSTPAGVHFTYDLDKGNIIQAWRGGFLNATPMWDSRGDGSSRPLGAVTSFNDDLSVSAHTPVTWPSDTTGSGYKPLGYRLDAQNIPTFQYRAFGKEISDKIMASEGQKLSRTIQIKDKGTLTLRLAEGSDIEKIGDGLYAVDGKTWYIEIPDSDKQLNGVTLRKSGNKQELIVPVNGQLNYNIIF